MASMKDVANKAGVSTATVSRVLTGFHYISPDIKEKVLSAIEELNYTPNRVARSLRVQQSNIIGLIVADIQNSFFTSVSRAVEDAAYSLGMTIFLCNSDENPEKEAHYLKIMQDENVAGIIIAPTKDLQNSNSLILDMNIPLVVIDRELSAINSDSILINNRQATEEAVEYLIKQGHKRIAGVFGTGGSTGLLRKEGYVDALKKNGLTYDPRLVFTTKAKEVEGYKAVEKLIALPELPDAIFMSNGLIAAGGYKALKDRKIAIPDTISFLTFDETIWTPMVTPSISVIKQPTYEIGKTAMELMIERIKNPDRAYRQIILNSEMVIRNSVKNRTSKESGIL